MIMHLAGQEITFSCPVPEAFSFQLSGTEVTSSVPVVVFPPPILLSRTMGWVAEDDRRVEIWTAGAGRVLRVEGFRDFYVAPEGQAILPVEGPGELTESERQVVLGPGLVLALALGGVWCLHASAAQYQGKTILFLGESGEGKSTLAAFLAEQPGWQRVADDILPVTLEPDGLNVWPHFPQLKLLVDAQPGARLPQQLPLGRVCLLTRSRAVQLTRLSPPKSLRAWLSHTAGTRMLDGGQLKQHLAFCAQAAHLAPVYQLAYPRRWSSLSKVQTLLEEL